MCNPNFGGGGFFSIFLVIAIACSGSLQSATNSSVFLGLLVFISFKSGFTTICLKPASSAVCCVLASSDTATVFIDVSIPYAVSIAFSALAFC